MYVGCFSLGLSDIKKQELRKFLQHEVNSLRSNDNHNNNNNNNNKKKKKKKKKQ